MSTNVPSTEHLAMFNDIGDYDNITFLMKASDNDFLKWTDIDESTDQYKFMKCFIYHVVIKRTAEEHWSTPDEGEWQNYLSKIISNKTGTTYTCNELSITGTSSYPSPFGYYRLWSGVSATGGFPPRIIKVYGYIFNDTCFNPKAIKDKLTTESLQYENLFVKFDEIMKKSYSGGISNRKKYTRKEIKSEKNIQDNKSTKKDNKPTKKDNKPTKKDNKPTKKDNKPLKTK
jgi:hypothetical protein